MLPTLASLMELPDGEVSFLDRPDAARLRCFVTGKGPTVVLAHGYLGSITNFNLLVPELVKRGHRVLVFEHRGFGRSTIGSDGMRSRPMADDYRAVLEHFDVDDAVLVGHSMGAFLTVLLCLEHTTFVREHLRGIVLVGGHAGNVAKASFVNRAQVVLLKMGVTKHAMRSRLLGRAITRPLFGETAEPVYLEYSRRMILETNIKPTIPILQAMIDEDHYARLGSIPVPARVICGELDQTCPRFHSEKLGAQIPNSENVWLDGVGHMVVFEEPEAILREIAALAPQASGPVEQAAAS